MCHVLCNEPTNPFAALACAYVLPVTPQKAHRRVWDTFKSLDEAWTNKTYRQQWLQLPVEAVQRVLDNERLAATSENVVYIVLASWISAQLK